ncbi:protein of unknown function [Ruminococcaceae bacterium BL-6]|nr:protein of unknown function [Ruminococcaceae bacterium BL-6]
MSKNHAWTFLKNLVLDLFLFSLQDYPFRYLSIAYATRTKCPSKKIGLSTIMQKSQRN